MKQVTCKWLQKSDHNISTPQKTRQNKHTHTTYEQKKPSRGRTVNKTNKTMSEKHLLENPDSPPPPQSTAPNSTNSPCIIALRYFTSYIKEKEKKKTTKMWKGHGPRRGHTTANRRVSTAITPTKMTLNASSLMRHPYPLFCGRTLCDFPVVGLMVLRNSCTCNSYGRRGERGRGRGRGRGG